MTRVKERDSRGGAQDLKSRETLYVHWVRVTSSDHDLPGVAGTALVLPSAYDIVVRKGLSPFGCAE
jgi:hypothetical protein